MPYSIRIDEQGVFEQADTKGHMYSLPPLASPATPVAVADRPAGPDACRHNCPSAPVTSEKPPPVPAKSGKPRPRQSPSRFRANYRKPTWPCFARACRKAGHTSSSRRDRPNCNDRKPRVRPNWKCRRWKQRRRSAGRRRGSRRRIRGRERAQGRGLGTDGQASEQALNDSMQRLRDTTSRIQAEQARPAAQSTQADTLRFGRKTATGRTHPPGQPASGRRSRTPGCAAPAKSSRPTREPTNNSSSAGDFAGAGHASTDTDANRCVTSPELRENDTFQGNTAAYVVNGCGTPVDVKICLMTESGWKCGVRWGLASQARWSHSVFHFTGPYSSMPGSPGAAGNSLSLTSGVVSDRSRCAFLRRNRC